MTTTATTDVNDNNDIISKYFEKSKAELKAEHESLVKRIREEITTSKNKALSKA